MSFDNISRRGFFKVGAATVASLALAPEKLHSAVFDDDIASNMSKVVLDKNIVKDVNILTQSMINQPNTIYTIQYDFFLNKNIVIPKNCVLHFMGGSISGSYNLVGQDTQIIAPLVKIFNKDITLNGTWCTEGQVRWFGANPANEDNAVYIQKCLDSFAVVNIDAFYRSSTITMLTKCRTLRGIPQWRDQVGFWAVLAPGQSFIKIDKGLGNPYPTIEDLRIVAQWNSNMPKCYVKDTIAINTSISPSEGRSIRLYNVEIYRFDVCVQSNGCSYRNHIDKCNFFYNNICFKDFNANNLLIESTKFDSNNIVLSLKGGEGTARIINCSAESTQDTIIKSDVICDGVVDFSYNHIEMYRGTVFEGKLRQINDIGNYYFVGGNAPAVAVTHLGALFNPKTICSMGNKYALGPNSSKQEPKLKNIFKLFDSNKEGAKLEHFVFLSNVFYFKTKSIRDTFSDVCFFNNMDRESCYIFGIDPKDNMEISGSYRKRGTTKERPFYRTNIGRREYINEETHRIEYWVVDSKSGKGAWYDAMGNKIT